MSLVNVDGIKIGDKLQIHCYKHDGSLHRTWDEAVVLDIFDDYMKGDGLAKIANNLNKEKIPSPFEYKKMHGSKLQIPLLKEYLDYEYIEDEKVEKISDKNKRFLVFY